MQFNLGFLSHIITDFQFHGSKPKTFTFLFQLLKHFIIRGENNFVEHFVTYNLSY